MVIFKGKNIQNSWLPVNGAPSWVFTTSPKGWTSNEIGLRWLREIFLPQTQQLTEPRLLLCDGHGSHATTEFMYECFQNHVYLIYLPPHTSHILQPLDLSCFSTVKSQYRTQITALSRLNDSSSIKKQQFISFYQNARTKRLTSNTIQSGFRSAGIVPFDPEKVLRGHFVTNQPIEEETELPRRPQTPIRQEEELALYTPANRRQLLQQAAKISTPRSTRRLLQKTSKAFDTLHTQAAYQQLQITSQQQRLDTFEASKVKRTNRDLNQQFQEVANNQGTDHHLSSSELPLASNSSREGPMSNRTNWDSQFNALARAFNCN